MDSNSNQSPAPSSLHEAIMDVLRRSADAWNVGDCAAFMTCYEDSASTTYMVPGRVVVGYAAIRDMYAKRFADAKPERKRTLSVVLDDVRPLGRGYALARGCFRLNGDGISIEPNEEPAGVFSLVLRDREAGWLIVADHTF